MSTLDGSSTTCNNEAMAKTTRIQGSYAGEGAVRQEGSLPLYQCNACGSEVVWATSNRTGRKYLVAISKGYHDQRFYVKANAHKCGEVLAERSKAVAHDAAHAEYMQAFRTLQAERKAGTVTDLEARIDELDRLADICEALK